MKFMRHETVRDRRNFSSPQEIERRELPLYTCVERCIGTYAVGHARVMSGDGVRDYLRDTTVVGICRQPDSFSRAGGGMVHGYAAFQPPLKFLGIFAEIVKETGKRGGAFSPEFFCPSRRKVRYRPEVRCEQMPFGLWASL
jgi:hypothetical protein